MLFSSPVINSGVLGVFLFFIIMLISALVSFYPDPVKNNKLSDQQISKIVLRKFYRGLVIKYILLILAVLISVKFGAHLYGLLTGMLLGLVLSLLFLFVKSLFQKEK